MTDRSVTIEIGSGDLVEPLPFTDLEYTRRLSAVRDEMRAQGLDFLVSFTPENMYYVTGHDSPGYYFYQACVVGLDQPPVNVLRRVESTNTLWRSWTRRVSSYEDREDPVRATIGVLSEMGMAGRRVGLEAEAWFVSPKRYLQLADRIRRLAGTVVEADGLIERVRVVKSPQELDYIRAAARVVESGMAAAIEASHRGTNENDVAAATLAALARSGGEYAGLPPFILSGTRTTLAHATWAGRVYSEGDLLNYELPGVVKRYCAPLFRSGTIGRPTPDLERRGEAVIEALHAVIASIRPGCTSNDAHVAGAEVLRRAGYGQIHRMGYSVGINYPPDWGEGHIMSIWEGDERTLRAGMTFHLIPSVWESGRSHIEISETVLVTDTGCEVLTNFPQPMFVV